MGIEDTLRRFLQREEALHKANLQSFSERLFKEFQDQLKQVQSGVEFACYDDISAKGIYEAGGVVRQLIVEPYPRNQQLNLQFANVRQFNSIRLLELTPAPFYRVTIIVEPLASPNNEAIDQKNPT